LVCFYTIFFFSSRRRHTRCLSDWSSDVCSSDLAGDEIITGIPVLDLGDIVEVKDGYARNYLIPRKIGYHATEGNLRTLEEEKKRSEERRVGKESRKRKTTKQ